MAVVKKVSAFLVWWWSSLASLLSFKPRRHMLVSVRGDDIQFKHLEGAVISEAVSKPSTATPAYLLISRDQSMIVTIPKELREQSLTQIVQALLPFERSEVFATVHRDRTQLFAVARSEVHELESVLARHGQSTAGVAFESDSGVLLVESERNLAVPVDHKPALVMAVSVLTVAGIYYFYLTNSLKAETRSLTALDNELSSLESGSSTETIATVAALPPMIKRNTLDRASEDLASVAEVLPPDLRLSQLTLSKNQLLLDATATSATEVRSRIEALEGFENTEFVSAISSDTANQLERFRLRVGRTD